MSKSEARKKRDQRQREADGRAFVQFEILDVELVKRQLIDEGLLKKQAPESHQALCAALASLIDRYAGGLPLMSERKRAENVMRHRVGDVFVNLVKPGPGDKDL